MVAVSREPSTRTFSARLEITVKTGSWQTGNVNFRMRRLLLRHLSGSLTRVSCIRFVFAEPSIYQRELLLPFGCPFNWLLAASEDPRVLPSRSVRNAPTFATVKDFDTEARFMARKVTFSTIFVSSTIPTRAKRINQRRKIPVTRLSNVYSKLFDRCGLINIGYEDSKILTSIWSFVLVSQ